MAKKSKNHPTATNFFHHFIGNILLGFSLLIVILFLGSFGYNYFETTNWIDSFTNAAMIVSGVGTLNSPQTDSGKIFIAIYSILADASFILIVAVVFSPIFHWIFRRAKVEDRDHFKD